MEQEELELIKKLQNTQIMQKAAYEDLETALNGSQNSGNSPDKMRMSQMSGGGNNYREISPMGGSD